METQQFNQFTWVAVKTTAPQDIKTIQETYHLDAEVLDYATDPNERAHVEYDDETKTFLLVFHVANTKKVDQHYEAVPMTFMIKNNTLITINFPESDYVIAMMQQAKALPDSASVYQFLFTSLFHVSDAFFPLVEQVDQERKEITERLKIKTTKGNLLSLSDLETGLIYLMTAAKQNAAVLEQLKALQIYKQLSETDQEVLDDALIEANQLSEMTQLTGQILDQLSGTYNNVLNNGLNDTMKFLTVWSLLLTIPTIVSGFFGMNVQLPFQHGAWSWVITLVIAAILWMGLGFLLRHFMNKS
ncbi:magnesium transporter CorA family protein [Secundilactobacillus paracollinoides]|uniref:Magnesium transporter CorA n=1 Tax=Secundilactobacillus paracollinoides TaxID=240427 RepID=A0A1B2J1H4_9LACO|nr:magnesium transporter CorA family protein [Secundilactobacillus paracollinoides]ANZ62186.1 magnesium transporter CorA [Secundilactobacillus paracollinoides]ANZ68133.1 magnesium transporter CorA [Secundilactobacillus paracollinoides]